MASLRGIDMSGVEAETPRGALPAGEYQAVITDSFNNNAQAVSIAKQRLKAIQDSVGVPNPGDSVQLHNRLLTVTVDVREYEGRESNEVKGYAVKRSSGQPMTQTSYPAPTAGQMANPFG